MQASLYRKLPAIDHVLQQAEFQPILAKYPRPLVLLQIQECLADIRSSIERGADEVQLTQLLSQLGSTVADLLDRRVTPGLRRVINATGVIIHTNLGRSPIAAAAVDFARDIATGYSNLEYDLETGQRSHREKHLEPLLRQIAGHEVAAAVVNNNAAAVMLILDTFAAGGEVIVSRGELVEIGGSFRIPDILEKSGARLREVGTTNKTRLQDYERALSEKTRLILRVHPSNFHIVGFTERPALADLADLARRHQLPLVEDLGSGLISDLSGQRLRNEPTVRQSLDAGVDLLCFSGDKLLGATQAGIILGKPRWIDPIRANPLTRALRIDKTGYAILLYSLHRYLDGRIEDLPLHSLLALPAADIRLRCENMARGLPAGSAEIQEAFSLVGGGSAPDVKIPTVVVAVRPPASSAESLHRFLRQQALPVVARIEESRVLFDLRTVAPEDDAAICAALNRFFSSAGPHA